MPFFTRRRLQVMLDQMSPCLGPAKARDILRRLEKNDVTQAIPAEMELALLWALNILGELEVEPEWWEGGGRPDAYTTSLIDGCGAAIEIATPNDNRISGEEAMDRVALAISTYVNSIRKGLGSHLYYRFGEYNTYSGGSYQRGILAPDDFTLTDNQKSEIRTWLLNNPGEKELLRLTGTGLEVSIEATKRKQTRYHNIWSSMPPETHSLTDNPLYELLTRKARQLRGAREGVLRLIFLADGGSTLLQRIGRVGEIDPTHRRVSGRQIVSNFVRKFQSRVDGVVVFAPERPPLMGWDREIQWSIHAFTEAGIPGLEEGLHRFASSLPRPRFEGYQARSLFRQGAYSPRAQGWYLAPNLKTRHGMSDSEISISARLFVDFLAGRITEEQFRHFLGDKPGQVGIVQRWLDQGMTISSVSLAPRSIDEDDDHLVLRFSDDPAARALRLPATAPVEPPPRDA